MTRKIIGDCEGKRKVHMMDRDNGDALPNFFSPQKSDQYRHNRNDNYDSFEYEYTDTYHFSQEFRNELLEPNAHLHSPNTHEKVQDNELNSHGDEIELRPDLESLDFSSPGSGILPLELAQYQRSSYNDTFDSDSFQNEYEGNRQNKNEKKQNPKKHPISFSNQGLIMAKVEQREGKETHDKADEDLNDVNYDQAGYYDCNSGIRFQREQRSHYQNELILSQERLEKNLPHTPCTFNNSANFHHSTPPSDVLNISQEAIGTSDFQRAEHSCELNPTGDTYRSVTTQGLMMIIEEQRRREAKLDLDSKSVSSRSAVSGIRYSTNEEGRHVDLYKQGTLKLRIQAASRQQSPPQAPNPVASHANPTQLALYEKGVCKARTERARMINEKREIASKVAKKVLPTTNARCDRLYKLSRSKQTNRQMKNTLGEKKVVIPTANACCDRLYNLSKAKQEKQRRDRELLERNKKIVTPTANARCDRLYNLSRKKQLKGKMRRQQAFEKSQINTSLSTSYNPLAKSKSVGSKPDIVSPISKRRVLTPAVKRRGIIPSIQNKINNETKELAQLVQERIASRSISIDPKFEKQREENSNDLFQEKTNEFSNESVADILKIAYPTVSSSKKGKIGSWSGLGLSTAADNVDRYLRIKIMQTTVKEKEVEGQQRSVCHAAAIDPPPTHNFPRSPLGNSSRETIELELKSKLKSLKTLAVDTNSYTYIGTSTDEYYPNSFHSTEKPLTFREPIERRTRDWYSQDIESREFSSASVMGGDYGVGRTMPDEDGYDSTSVDRRECISFFRRHTNDWCRTTWKQLMGFSKPCCCRTWMCAVE